MRTKIDCCWGCPDRVADPNCHGYCEKYKQQKAEYEATKAEMDKQAKIQNGLSGQSIDGVGKATHHRHLHHKSGRWKALHPNTAVIVPENPKATKKNSKPARLCRWCGKEIPETANAHRRYCCAECAYEGKLSAANERYREKKRRENPENNVKP